MEEIKKLQNSESSARNPLASKSHFGLSCFVYLEKRKYKIDEPIDVEIRLKNTGNEFIEFPVEKWEITKYDASLTYGYASKVGSSAWSDIAPFKSNGQVIRQLKPGEEVKVDLSLSMSAKQPISNAIISAQLSIGTMRINGNLNVPEGYTGWTGNIESNEIEIEFIK